MDLINAAAYEKGFTGRGVTIGVSDAPVNFASPAFSTKRSRSDASGFSPTYVDEDGTTYAAGDTGFWFVFFHGTHVSGIAAASRNDLGMHGVAFDAEVRSSVYFEEYAWWGTDIWSGWAKAFLDDPAIRAVNCSWGWPLYATGEIYTMTDYLSELREDEAYRERAEILNSEAAEKDTLFVFAAGNSGFEMPALESTLHWLAGRNASTHVISVAARTLTARARSW